MIDSDLPYLRNVQASKAHFRQALAAADIENAIAGPRPERFGEELGEVGGPPSLAQVLQRGGLESVDRRGHLKTHGCIASVRHRELARHDGPRAREQAKAGEIADERQDADEDDQLGDVGDRVLWQHFPHQP